jgi:copper transport protein
MVKQVQDKDGTMRRWLVIFGIGLALLAVFAPVSAHANLVRIDPPPGTALTSAPPEINLWFSEGVEPQFSRILIRDQNGTILPTANSQFDPNDPTHMSLATADLPNGLYTVVWRALSSSDGHSTLGSFPLVIGQSASTASATTESIDTIPVDGALVRWLNLISLAMGVGGMAFVLFVWNLAVPEKNPAAERRLHRVIWFGWILIGITGFLMILLQYELATGSPLLTGINGSSLNGLVANTRFGHLWLARMALWAGMGGALWFGRSDPWFNWIALLIGGAILAINSVFSHANAVMDVTASVAADWIHLLATALWVGGLVQFILVIGVVRRSADKSTATRSHLVGYFSNFARVSVAALAVTGLYSAWLQIGSLDALFSTNYGRALLVKILLFFPVMGIAAINLFYTHRGLKAGLKMWEGRLRNLVGVEIALTFGILLAVGMMTSISPARGTLDQRLANPPPPDPQPVSQTVTANDVTLALTFTPGWIGNNDFTLKVTGSDGEPVNDATLVRMKFESQTQNIGESELRPALTGDGVYTISGANLSVPGAWRIRVTIQRPNQYDALADFTPDVPAAPEPPPIVPLPAPDAPLPDRVTVLLLAGVVALAVGGFFLGENRFRPLRASALLSVGLLVAGVLFLASAMQGTAPVSAAPTNESFQPAPQAPVRLAVTSNQNLPYLVTADGRVLQPGTDSQWHALPLDAKVRDIYIDIQNTVWAATDSGLYAYKDDQWTQEATRPVSRLVMTHGYLFALGENGGITRVPAGGGGLEPIRELKTPLADQGSSEFVMLGNHTHILQNGDQLYHTQDLGLSWEPLESSQPIAAISTDIDGNLLVAENSGVATWNYTGIWENPIPLPGGDPNPVLRTYNEHVYAVGGGGLYLQAGSKWDAISLPDSDGAYLDSLEFQYPRTLWVLDAKESRLWSTDDGKTWTLTRITVR